MVAQGKLHSCFYLDNYLVLISTFSLRKRWEDVVTLWIEAK